MKVIALDGQDASGKTTFAKMLETQFAGKYVKPYYGEIGEEIEWLWRRKRYVESNELAKKAVETVLCENMTENILFFDRYWLSQLTVLPPIFHSWWENKCDTIVCWSNPLVTTQRLINRGEKGINYKEQEYWCDSFYQLAVKYNLCIVDTNNDDIFQTYQIIKQEVERMLKNAK